MLPGGRIAVGGVRGAQNWFFATVGKGGDAGGGRGVNLRIYVLCDRAKRRERHPYNFYEDDYPGSSVDGFGNSPERAECWQKQSSCG